VKVPAETLLAAAGRSMIARRLMWRQIATAFVVALLFLSAAPRASANRLVLNSTGRNGDAWHRFNIKRFDSSEPGGNTIDRLSDHVDCFGNLRDYLQLQRRQL